jgi:hypothetical protein
VAVAFSDDKHERKIFRKGFSHGREKWGRIQAFNIYSENSCSIASVADRGRQLEVITYDTPVEVTKPLALGDVIL